MIKAKLTDKQKEGAKAEPVSKAGAPEGNSNAEKWTEAAVVVLLEAMEAEAEDCIYLGELLVRHKLYSEIWTYWKDKFAGNDIVFQPIKRIEQVFEAKLFKGGLTGALNPTTVIFGLKNNHNWKDKIEQDLTTKGESLNKKADLSKLTNEELKQMAAIENKIYAK